jgi:isopentenyldiphosphate isomerase
MQDEDEILEIVDALGNVIGSARRQELHGNPALIHRVVHVLVFNRKGCLLLQKRSLSKDVAPGKWDTSVGGHVNPGESGIDAARREMREELGIDVYPLDFLYAYLYSNHIESELISTFSCMYDGELSEISFNRAEIDEVGFRSLNEIEKLLGSGIFSNQFEQEFIHYKQSGRTGAAG